MKPIFQIKNLYFQISIGIVLLFLCSFCSEKSNIKKPPVAIQGVLDLKDWNFEKDGILSLTGEWEFYWEKLLTEKDFIDSKNIIQPSFVKVPMIWEEQIIDGKEINNVGYATFRIKIINWSESGLLYKFIRTESSYKVIYNHKILIESGVIGKNKESSSSGYSYHISAFPDNNKEVYLIVQISNYHYLIGGFTHPFLLGKEKDILKIHDRALFVDFFISGSLLIMGLYHLGIYLLRKKEKSNLYFALFCILLSIRSIVTGEYYLHTFFMGKYFDPLIRLDLLTVYLSTPIFILYISYVFPEESNSIFKKLILIPSFILTLIVILLPPIYSRITLTTMHVIIIISCLFTVYIVIQALKHKREGGKPFLIGSILFIILVINDILSSHYIIKTGLYVPVGFFIFIFSQAYILSYRSARAYYRVEELSEDLTNKTNEMIMKNYDLSDLSIKLSSANTKLNQILEFAKLISTLRNKISICVEGYKSILIELRWNTKSNLIIYFRENSSLYKKHIFSAKLKGEELIISPKTDSLLIKEKASELLNIESYTKVIITSKSLIVPIIYKEKLYCIFEIFGIDEKKFSEEDKKYVETIAEALAITMANLYFFNEQKEKIRMEMELQTASLVQNALFPSLPPSVPGLDIYGFCKTASEIGGDWFGFSTKINDYLYIFIGDVTGHGSAAGLITSAIYSVVKRTEKVCVKDNKIYSPMEWNELLNEVVCEIGIEDYYMTFLTVRISINTGEMLYSNAAHCSPIILRNGNIDFLRESASLFFGLEQNLILDQGKFQLKKNDILILYTDGIYEARNDENEMFGIERTQEFLLTLEKNNSKQIVEGLYSNIVKYCNNLPHQDDVTLIAIRVLEDFSDII